MPANHRHFGDWDPQRLIRWAGETGPATSQLVEGILTRYVHPEHGYRGCLGVMSLGKKYGSDRVEAACARAVFFGAFSYRNVKQILASSLDRAPLPEPEQPALAPVHANIRGAAYYGSAQSPQLRLDMER
jgi:transposase